MAESAARDLVIFDFDGVLVELGLRPDETRLALRELFRRAGLDVEFRPMSVRLEESLERVAALHSPQRADELRREAWAIIDADERRAATGASLRPGVRRVLDALRDQRLAVISNNRRDVVEAVLARNGIESSRFVAIIGREEARPIKPSAAPLLSVIAGLETPPGRIFSVGDHIFDMRSARLASDALPERPPIIAVGLHAEQSKRIELERAGAGFLIANLDELVPLVRTPRLPLALSIVLLAYNEAGSIGAAIEDARRFGSIYLDAHEIVVVDDGSRDGTAAEIESVSGPDLVVVRHSTNLGMGASMRDGYAAASLPYRVHLPGDRQVRPQALLAFLPHCQAGAVVISHYLRPHAGRLRELYSWAFRRAMSVVGGLQVDFAGTYVFHEGLYRRVDPRRTQASTFVYSYELLEELRRAGALFREVSISPLLREVGSSKVDSARRIVRVLGELAQSRARRLRNIFGGRDG